MTMKKKIYTIGAITFVLFVILALMNIRTHQEVLSNLHTRDRLNDKLADIEEFTKWKNGLIRSISEIVASGRAPFSADDLFTNPVSGLKVESAKLTRAGKALVSLIGEKEHAVTGIERRYGELRLNINELYYKLDKRIATVLAVAQMDKVLGSDTSEKNSLAPYVLKSLNQLTLVALNGLIAKNFTEEDRGVIGRNRHFLSTQLKAIDENGGISALFDDMFLLIGTIEAFINNSNHVIANFSGRIAAAKKVFDQAVSGTAIAAIAKGARLEAERANEALETASSRTLATVIAFLVVVPIALIVLGILGLNSFIVGPISSLVEAMKNVENGGFEVTAPVRANDEIGALARAFNAMAAEIRTKVTELSRLNQVLTKSEAKYRTLVENLPQRIFLKNKDLTYVSCNLNYARDLKIRAEEIAGKTDFDFFPWELAEKYRSDDTRILETGKTEEIEESYIQSGREMTIQTVKTPLRDDEGNISGILAIFWDITERKEAERIMMESRELHRSIIQTAMDGFWLVDLSGRLLEVNKAYCRMSGYSERELLTMSIHDLDAYDKDHNVRDRIQDVVQKSEDRFERKHRRKDGRLFEVEISVQHRAEKGGRMVCFLRDVTDRKKLEAQLVQAQKMEAVGTLAGGVAHDFNNLLQAINGYTQIILMDTGETDPAYKHLQAIQRAGDRAADLVKQLLIFSRKADSKRQSINLNQEIGQARSILERTIPKMIEIKFIPGGRLWGVSADPVQIEQILLNLGKNAADAMPDGGALVFETENARLDEGYTFAHLEVQPGPYVLLTVTDTGHGMDPETRKHIFEPFFTTKGIGEGTGLGLSSVYGIVKNHGGTINCYSEVGRGTTFKIYLPATEEIYPETGAEDEEAIPRGGAETILIVDDEEPIRDFASQVVRQFGYTPLTASSGEEALEIYLSRGNEIDLVIMDIGMPGMGGHKCLQELIKIDPGVRVIIASGYSIEGQIQQSLDLGAAGYVGKPYRANSMIQKIRTVLDGA